MQYSYDQLNRLLTINQSKNGVTPLASYTYTLDKAGNRTGVTEGSGRTIAWGYDNAYRLTSEIYGGPRCQDTIWSLFIAKTEMIEPILQLF